MVKLILTMAAVPFFAPRATQEELAHIQGRMVHLIHRDVKQGFFSDVPEVLRIKVDLKPLVTLIRGEQFVRMQTMRGEDFLYIVFRSSLQLHSSRLMSILETLGYFLKTRFAIDLLSSDLGIDPLGGSQPQCSTRYLTSFLSV